MRQQIIEALTYPRILLLANLDVEKCPQHLIYNYANEGCRNCAQREECQWLNVNDEFSVLALKPLDSLVELLQFCIDYVDAKCAYDGHNVRRCACESCYWVRSAHRLHNCHKAL